MKRIIVTGATSMIGTALIEECIRHDIEVYAVVRAGSSKTKRLPESARIHQIECELENWKNFRRRSPENAIRFSYCMGKYRGKSKQQYRAAEQKCLYTLKAVRAAHAMGCKDLSEQVHRQNMDRWMFRGSHRTVRYIRRRLTVRASSLQTSFLPCFVRNSEWNGSGREFQCVWNI